MPNGATALKQRLLRLLCTEKRALSYFNSAQRAAILEMIDDGWIKTGHHSQRILTITGRGRNVLKTKR